MARIRFGSFLAPHHPVGSDPTLQFQLDLGLVAHLDRLGFDGRFREMPAVPPTVAVAVSVPARAAADATSASAETIEMMNNRCLMGIRSPSMVDVLDRQQWRRRR